MLRILYLLMNNRGYKKLREEINPQKESIKLFLLVGIAFGIVLTVIEFL